MSEVNEIISFFLWLLSFFRTSQKTDRAERANIVTTPLNVRNVREGSPNDYLAAGESLRASFLGGVTPPKIECVKKHPAGPKRGQKTCR